MQGGSDIRIAHTPKVPWVLKYTLAGRVRLAISLGANATVFQAEILRIILAGQACGGRVGHGGTVKICSDCQAAIRAVRAHTITSGLVLSAETSWSGFVIHTWC